MAFKYYAHRDENNRFIRKSHINTDTDLEPETENPVEISEEVFKHTYLCIDDIINDDGTITEYVNKYKELRKLSYPSIGEQLDKLYHDINNGTLTTDGDFFTAINTVKTDNPKPE